MPRTVNMILVCSSFLRFGWFTNDLQVEISCYLPKLDRHWNGDGPAPDRLVEHGDLAVASSEDEVTYTSS